jgi:hypothetical protein
VILIIITISEVIVSLSHFVFFLSFSPFCNSGISIILPSRPSPFSDNFHLNQIFFSTIDDPNEWDKGIRRGRAAAAVGRAEQRRGTTVRGRQVDSTRNGGEREAGGR